MVLTFVQALLPFLGKHDTTLQLEGLGVGSRVENAGLAVNADGTVMAVCSQSLDSITLYR